MYAVTIRTFVFIFAAFGVTAGAFAQSSLIIRLPHLNGVSPATTGNDIGDDASIVIGESVSLATAQGVFRAYRWTPGGGMVTLGALTVDGHSFANGVSSSGSAIAGTATTAALDLRATRWTQATGLVNLGTIGNEPGNSISYDISGDGNVVIGESHNATVHSHAFRWTQAGGMQDLRTIGNVAGASAALATDDDGSVVVGRSITPFGTSHAFRWTQTLGMVGLSSIVGPTGESAARGVSGDGSIVVGQSTSEEGDQHAFVWQGTGMADLGTIRDLDGDSSASDVSDDGRVIVGTSINVEDGAACVWIDGTAYGLKELLVEHYGFEIQPDEVFDACTRCSRDGLRFAVSGRMAGVSTAWMVSLSEINRRAIGTVPAPVAFECEGGEHLVTLRTRVEDPDGDPIEVFWLVDGVVRKVQSGVASGDLCEFEYDYPFGRSDVEVQIHDDYVATFGYTSVTVNDTVAPVVVVASDVSVNVDPGESFATGVRLPRPDVFDACDPKPNVTNDAPAQFPLGGTDVTWTVRDAVGNEATAVQKVTVINRDPIARFEPGRVGVRAGAKRARVQFDATHASDPDEHDLTYEWSAPNVVFDDPTSATPTATLPLGRTAVTLKVTDELGAAASTRVVVKVETNASSRPLGGYANFYAQAAFEQATSALSAPGGYSESGVNAYIYAYYGYIYGVYAGDSFTWGGKVSRGEAFASYSELRYYQYLFDYYAMLYGEQRYNESPDDSALYAYIYAIYAQAYAGYDLGF